MSSAEAIVKTGKATVRAPYFEVSIKNYLYGDAVLALAEAADACAAEVGVDVVFVTPYTEIRRVAERTSHLKVFAPYMDSLRPGRGIAAVLPEAVRAAGADGVVLNHVERPMSLAELELAIERARELDLLSFVCAGSPLEAGMLARLGPDILNPEPADRIGTPSAVDLGFMRAADAAVKEVDDGILVEIAAGISSPEDVHAYIAAGADGCGAASGIMLAPDPAAMLTSMIEAVGRGARERAADAGGAR
jgi:triosephosphate isomerase (TIM)